MDTAPKAPARRPTLLLSAALLTALTLLATAAAVAGGWEEVGRDRGVVVYSRDAGDLATFRGVGVVEANVYDVLAVIWDTSRLTEWTADCQEARVVEELGPDAKVVYVRADAPWPVDDRDAVTRVTLSRRGEALVVSHRLVSGRVPEVDGVVRVPHLRAHYILAPLGEGRTRVTYEVEASPGGMVPDWIVKRVQEDGPIDTLVGLRRQVQATRGRYGETIARLEGALGPK